MAGEINLKRLRAFQLVAKHGGLSPAAARLRLTVPAVSFQIRRLEDELGAQLFQRLPNGLVLTVSGQNFVREVDGIFRRIEAAKSVLTAKPDLSGPLSVATSSDIVWYLTRGISNFINAHPAVEFSHHVYTSDHTLTLVRRGDLDAGIGYFPEVSKSLQKELITESTLSLVMPEDHPLLRRQPPRLEDIARYKLVVLPHQSATRRIVDSVFSTAGVKIRNAIEAGNCQAAREFAVQGVGIALGHSLCVGQVPAGRLRYVDLGQQFGKVDFSVIYRRGKRHSPALQAFIDQVTGTHEPERR